MTTCRDVIRAALRKINAVSYGDEPSANEANDGLAALQSLYLEWIEGGVFGRLAEVIATANYAAGEGERVASSGFTITLPTTVTDEDTGVARAPADLAVAIVTTAGSEPSISLYDANRAEWVTVSGLGLSDNAPLAGRGSDGLAACLAKKICGDYGASLNDQGERSAARFMASIAMKRTSRYTAASYF